MPKIQSETVEITLSKLIKSSMAESDTSIVPEDLVTTLESIVQELVGDSIVVEISIK